MQLDFGRVQHSDVRCECLSAIKTFFLSNYTYGYLVMQLRFGETVFVTLWEKGKTN